MRVIFYIINQNRFFMNKKLLSLLLLVTAAFTTAFAQETLTVYNGTNTNGNVPIYGLYVDAFQKSETVFAADSLEALAPGSTITGLTWYLNAAVSEGWTNAQFIIFMKEVSATTIDAYYGTEGATVVYEGPISPTNLAIEFTEPYTYQGGNLLIGVYVTAKGSYKSATFVGKTVEGASVSGYSSSSLDAVTTYQRNFVPKTTFSYIPAGTAVYHKPKNLQVSNITPNSATLTWEAGGEETAWNVEYKKAADEEWTSAHVTEMTYALDALTNGTVYEVRVQGDYGDGNLSPWATSTFNTLLCDEDEMGDVAYDIYDAYGDGWGSCVLQIVSKDAGVVVQSLTLPSGANKDHITGTVKLCYGVEYNLVWIGNQYTYECGLTLTAPDGTVIYDHPGSSSSTTGTAITPGVIATFTINQVTCPRPTELAATNVVFNGATLTWTPGNEEQDAWQVIYAAGEFNPDEINQAPVDVTGEATLNLTGLTENTTYTAYVRGNCGENDKSSWSEPVTFTTPLQFPIPTELTISDITATTAKASWAGNAESYNLRYRPINKGNYVLDESFESGIPSTWTNLDSDADGNKWAATSLQGSEIPYYDGPAAAVSASYINGTGALTPDNWLITPQVTFSGKLRFAIRDTGYRETYAVYVSTGGTATDDFVAIAESTQTTAEWVEHEIDLSAYEGQQGYIAFRHFDCTDGYFLLLDKVTIGTDAPESEWTTVENATSPYDMEGLTPGTQYEVQVQGVYAEGNSDWTEIVNFTTNDGLDVPTQLAVSEVTHNSAVATWEGTQESYNLRYRKAGSANVLFFDSFENGLDAWTLVDTDGDGKNWQLFNPTTFNDGGYPAYDGDYAVMTRSWLSGALTPDQWLISPKIDNLGSMLQFFVHDDGVGGYPETYQVYVSTTDTEIASFTAVSEKMQSPSAVDWTEVTVDLSAYAGQAGYIAFRHYDCTDMDYMLIDAVSVLGDVVPAGEWTVVENVTTPYTIEGLDPETKYEVEVQGIFGENTTEWTEPVEFTTLEAPVLPEYSEFYVVGDFNDWNQTEEGGRVKLVANEEGTEYTGTVEMVAQDEFKVITPNPNPTGENDQWIWFGGVDENQMGYFLIDNAMLDVEISLINGSNFQVLAGGEYTITVKAPQADGTRALQEPLVMVVTMKPTAISTINSGMRNDNAWYGVNGIRYENRPTVKGVYIHNGKKVVIK